MDCHASSFDCLAESLADSTGLFCLLKQQNTAEVIHAIIQHTEHTSQEKKKQKSKAKHFHFSSAFFKIKFLDCKVKSNQLEIFILFLCINLAD